jgi:hypothetical protein
LLKARQGPEVERVILKDKQIIFGSKDRGWSERGRNNKDARLKKIFPFLKLMFLVFF